MKTTGKVITNLTMKISTDFVIEELVDQVQSAVLAAMVKNGEDIPDIDEGAEEVLDIFNEEPPCVLVNLSLPDARVSWFQYEDVKPLIPTADNYLSEDIVTTYLSSGDLCILTVYANGGSTFGVGAVDRTTAVGMFCTKNWFDADWMADIKMTTEWNSAMKLAGESESKYRPINSHLKEVRNPHTKIAEEVLKRSEARLHTLLVDMIAVNYKQAYGQSINYMP